MAAAQPIDYDIVTLKHDTEKFQWYAPVLQQVMESECFPHRVSMDPGIYDVWYVLVHRRTRRVISVLALDKNNTIWNLCTVHTRRKRGYAAKLVEHVKSRHKFLTLSVDGMGPTRDTLIQYYQKLGFTLNPKAHEGIGQRNEFVMEWSDDAPTV